VACINGPMAFVLAGSPTGLLWLQGLLNNVRMHVAVQKRLEQRTPSRVSHLSRRARFCARALAPPQAINNASTTLLYTAERTAQWLRHCHCIMAAMTPS
jgi:hypothetical protein